MPVLSTLEVTLRDAEAEGAFLATFTKAAQNAGAIPGLLELKAYKLLGAEFTYMAQTLWESEAHIQAWLENEQEHAFMREGGAEMISKTRIRRFLQLRGEKLWERNW